MISKLKRDFAVRFRSKLQFKNESGLFFCFVVIFLSYIKSWFSCSLNTSESWSCIGLSWGGLFDSTTVGVNQIRLEYLDHAWQVGPPPGRKASWGVYAPCS